MKRNHFPRNHPIPSLRALPLLAIMLLTVPDLFANGRPDNADIRTACTRVRVNCAGNLGDGGINKHNLNFFDDCDTTMNTNGQDDNAGIYLYDASPFVLRIKGNDTVLNCYFLDAYWLHNGFEPLTGLTRDTGNSDFQYMTCEFIPPDSTMRISCEYWGPLHPDTCGFIVQRIRFDNRTASNISNVRLGELVDWDIPSDSGVENQSSKVPGEMMVYQRGYEYAPDSIVNNDCILADQRMGGFGYINGYKLPYNSSGDRFGDIALKGGMMTLPFRHWCSPTGNFVPSQLWQKTSGFTGYETWQSTQPSMEDSAAQDLVMVAYFGNFNLGVNDTLVFIKILAVTKDGLSDLTASLGKAKAWIGGHLNSAPVLRPIGNKSGYLTAPLTFTVFAYDVDGNALTFSGENLPEGSSIDPVTGVFNWPLPHSLGTYENITFRVSDGRETDQETIKITIVCSCCNTPGDANNNGLFNIQDVTYMINHLYKGGPTPPCREAADCNADGAVNVRDVTCMINRLYHFPTCECKCPEC